MNTPLKSVHRSIAPQTPYLGNFTRFIVAIKQSIKPGCYRKSCLGRLAGIGPIFVDDPDFEKRRHVILANPVN